MEEEKDKKRERKVKKKETKRECQGRVWDCGGGGVMWREAEQKKKLRILTPLGFEHHTC